MAGEVMFIKWISWKHCEIGKCLEIKMAHINNNTNNNNNYYY